MTKEGKELVKKKGIKALSNKKQTEDNKWTEQQTNTGKQLTARHKSRQNK